MTTHCRSVSEARFNISICSRAMEADDVCSDRRPHIQDGRSAKIYDFSATGDKTATTSERRRTVPGIKQTKVPKYRRTEGPTDVPMDRQTDSPFSCSSARQSTFDGRTGRRLPPGENRLFDSGGCGDGVE